MPKVLVPQEDGTAKEVPLSKARTTIGRRPYNDIVLDQVAVSGEHAILERLGTAVLLEDLNSTNGTRVNGKRIKLVQLGHGDKIDIGKCVIQFVDEAREAGKPEPAPNAAGPTLTAAPRSEAGSAASATGARVRVLAGPNAGDEVALTKIVTTFGKPDGGVLAITHRAQGHVLSHIEGTPPTVNGAPVSGEPVLLTHADQIALPDLRLQFLLH